MENIKLELNVEQLKVLEDELVCLVECKWDSKGWGVEEDNDVDKECKTLVPIIRKVCGLRGTTEPQTLIYQDCVHELGLGK